MDFDVGSLNWLITRTISKTDTIMHIIRGMNSIKCRTLRYSAVNISMGMIFAELKRSVANGKNKVDTRTAKLNTESARFVYISFGRIQCVLFIIILLEINESIIASFSVLVKALLQYWLKYVIFFKRVMKILHPFFL